ncbi:MAG: HAMP domain-containing sensor histidine kinase [Balneolaceae bacterium]|nr:HAMP domain-containing sensor histidine kinase [Balneolaceae bacterium]
MQAAGENLADGRVDNQERLKTYGKHIHNEAIRLRKMIEKLLDVAKADVGETLIEPKVVCPASLVKQYINEHRSYIEEKGFTLETSIQKDISPTKLDIESFDAIISNLVENSIKYSWKDKYIHISLYESNGEITLRVEDHGRGISKKAMKHIFEKFYRAEDTLKAKTKGHGLGLSIVKNLVELNGGTIRVESEENKGTVFLVSFPIIEEAETEAVEEPDFAAELPGNIQLT